MMWLGEPSRRGLWTVAGVLARWRSRQPARYLPVIVAVAALTALLAGGCFPAPESAAPEPPAPYPLGRFDLCERVDTRPLDRLSLTIWDVEPSTPGTHVDGGGQCTLGMRNSIGYGAELLVESYIVGSVSEAEELYRSEKRQYRTSTRSEETTPPEDTPPDVQSDGVVDGVGDQSEAFTREWEWWWGTTYTEYAIVARAENLVIHVLLGMGGGTFASKDRLADVARETLTTTIAAMPPAAPPSAPPPKGMAYDVTGLDLCDSTDLSPLDDLSLTLLAAEEGVDGPDACGFDLEGDGSRVGDVWLDVAVRTTSSAFDAEVEYYGIRDYTEPVSEGGGRFIDGIGDRSEGFDDVSDEWAPPGFTQLRYNQITLSGNLTVVVELTMDVVRADANEQKATLPRIVNVVSADTLALVPLTHAG